MRLNGSVSNLAISNRLVLVFKIKVFIAEGVVDFGMLMGMRILV